MQIPPRVFISYSHDDQNHKDWVLNIATRLVANGVDVILDQWDLTLGSDLPRFMERGLVNADRVLAVCSEAYVDKANLGKGGTGYEKMILTGQLMQNVSADRIIPVIRKNPTQELLPTFLLSRLFVDFRDEQAFEARYAELLRDIHGLAIKPRPPLGANPFTLKPSAIEPRVSFSPERYASPALTGMVTFDYSNNNGQYNLGSGDMLFETRWSGGSTSSVHAYASAQSIRTVALASGAVDISHVVDASVYDTSSDHRSPLLGEVVIWQNSSGHYLATKVEKLQSRKHGSDVDEIVFSYGVAPNKSSDFRSVVPLKKE